MSYSRFEYSLRHSLGRASSAGELDLAPVRALIDEVRAANRSFVPRGRLASEAPLIRYEVHVKNTGSVDADDVVLGFLTPPGAGAAGVPLKSLFGFERVHVKVGETATVFLYPSLADFAAVDAEGRRSATAGEYTVSFGVRETAGAMGYVEHRFMAV